MTRALVFVSHATSTSIPIEVAEKVHTSTDTNIIVASLYNSDESEFDEDVQKNEAQIIPLDGSHRLDISAYRKLLALAKQKDIDVLHTHQNSIGSIARAVFSGSDIAIVNTEHRNHRSFSTFQRLVNAPTFPAVDRMVSNSQTTRLSFYPYEELLSKNATHHIVYNGVDLEKVDYCRKQHEYDCNNKYRIVTVGRLVDIKNQQCLLQALPQVLTSFPNTELVIVGEGPKRDHLQSIADELGISDSVCFTGKVPREEVYRILDSSDVFVISSKSEGFCVAAVEAMACNLPVVASDIETLHEVVGSPGIYATVDCPDEFATAILELLEDDPLRESLGQRARTRATEKFELANTAEEYNEIYKDAVGRGNQ